MKFHKEAKFQKRKAKGGSLPCVSVGGLACSQGGLCEAPVPALAVPDAVVFVGSPRRTTGMFQVEHSGLGRGKAGAGGGVGHFKGLPW